MSVFNSQTGVFIVLLDWEVGRRLESLTWTQNPSYVNCWGATVDVPSTIKILCQGVILTQQASISLCNSVDLSYFYDSGTLWVNPLSPPISASIPMIGYVWERYSTHKVNVSGVKYFDYLEESCFKNISISTSGFHEGHTKITFGSVSLINADGYFDAKLSERIYLGKYMKIYSRRFDPPVDYENLVLTDFSLRWEGWSGNIEWKDDEITVNTIDYRKIRVRQ